MYFCRGVKIFKHNCRLVPLQGLQSEYHNEIWSSVAKSGHFENSNLASIFNLCILFIKFLISSKIEETEMLKLRPQPPSFLRHGKKFCHHSRIQREGINLFSFENLINFLAQWIIINQQFRKLQLWKFKLLIKIELGKPQWNPTLFPCSEALLQIYRRLLSPTIRAVVWVVIWHHCSKHNLNHTKH